MDNHCTIGFYDNLVEQDFRRWYSYGVKFPNYVSGHFLSPFFFCLPKSGIDVNRPIRSIEFYQICCTEMPRIGSGDFNIDFSSDFLVYGASERSWEDCLFDNGLVANIVDNYVIVSYPANTIKSLDMSQGFYYMKFTMSNGVVQYSDVFVACDIDISHRLINVEWWNEENIKYANGIIPYGTNTNFKNQINLDTEIGLPEYTYTEEGKERDGYFFPIKQISEKTYHFTFYAPEYIIDSMRLIRMSDRVRITDQMGVEYQCDTFDMDVEWLEQGHYARVDCSFQTDSVIKMIGKAYNTISDR